jgi:hypothetical protein
MHAATPDTQPRAASTRQLISKGLHIKNHITDLDIEHRERERERERIPLQLEGVCKRNMELKFFHTYHSKLYDNVSGFQVSAQNYFQSSRQFYCCAI